MREGTPLVERRGFGGKTGIHPPLAGGQGEGASVRMSIIFAKLNRLMQPVMLRRAPTFPHESQCLTHWALVPGGRLLEKVIKFRYC